MTASLAATVGKVFTPPARAAWLLRTWSVFEAWRDGASVCDPTAGDGVFILSLLRMARDRGLAVTQEMLRRLAVYDVDPQSILRFRAAARALLPGLEPPRAEARDIILSPPRMRFDMLIGNPPWANFTDLPEEYKEVLKPVYLREGLVGDRRMTLLGGSRVDIAALVLQITLGRLLKRKSEAYFYVPLSLFCGDDAHKGFRAYRANARDFAVRVVYEFTRTRVFSDVATAYCCAAFAMDSPHAFPVRYLREADGSGTPPRLPAPGDMPSAGQWEEHAAFPLLERDDAWRIRPRDAGPPPAPAARLPELPRPRQGINTCGANDAFIFDAPPEGLPARFLYPLATGTLWKAQDPTPRKWVLLPHDRETGKPLTPEELTDHPALLRYLLSVEHALRRRKGALIGAQMRQGRWWALFGVGAYAFAPFKVIWQAYGKRHFAPIILEHVNGQPWQANQAMQAYIPCQTREEAHTTLTALRHPAIQDTLSELNGAGRCNWAQPGKMRKVLAMFMRPHPLCAKGDLPRAKGSHD